MPKGLHSPPILAHSGSMEASPIIVLIDGDCALCNRTAQWFSARDTRGTILFATNVGETARILGEPPGGDHGTVVAWGDNTYGQLGIEQAQGNSVGESLQKVAEELKFESIACGSEHSFGIAAETGELYAWGLNFIGQLGLCDYENRSEPCQVLSINSNT